MLISNLAQRRTPKYAVRVGQSFKNLEMIVILGDDKSHFLSGILDRCFTVATNGKAVHFEFNQDGSEVMVSDWDPDGAVIVLDSTTLTEVRRFTGLPTPTGKFNVTNTAGDIY